MRFYNELCISTSVAEQFSVCKNVYKAAMFAALNARPTDCLDQPGSSTLVDYKVKC